MENQSFEHFLAEQLNERKYKNRSFSLRSFAKTLDISPSYLSLIMTGKKPASQKVIQKIGDRLGVEPSQLHQWTQSKNKEDKQEPLADFMSIALDEFKLMSNWHYFAILETFKLENFVSSYEWIAKVLNISTRKVEESIITLERLNFIDLNKKPWKLIRANNSVAIGERTTSSAKKNLQRQVLEKAALAMDNVILEKRSQSSITFAIDTGKLPQALEKIKIFKQEMSDLLTGSKQKNEIYNLSVSMYPVSTNNIEEKLGESK